MLILIDIMSEIDGENDKLSDDKHDRRQDPDKIEDDTYVNPDSG